MVHRAQDFAQRSNALRLARHLVQAAAHFGQALVRGGDGLLFPLVLRHGGDHERSAIVGRQAQHIGGDLQQFAEGVAFIGGAVGERGDVAADRQSVGGLALVEREASAGGAEAGDISADRRERQEGKDKEQETGFQEHGGSE